MRSVINISLPSSLVRPLEQLVKDGQYASKSEFLRHLIRERLEEEDILAQVKKSQREFRSEKGKVLRSLKDLR